MNLLGKKDARMFYKILWKGTVFSLLGLLFYFMLSETTQTSVLYADVRPGRNAATEALNETASQNVVSALKEIKWNKDAQVPARTEKTFSRIAHSRMVFEATLKKPDLDETYLYLDLRLFEMNGQVGYALFALQ